MDLYLADFEIRTGGVETADRRMPLLQVFGETGKGCAVFAGEDAAGREEQ